MPNNRLEIERIGGIDPTTIDVSEGFSEFGKVPIIRAAAWNGARTFYPCSGPLSQIILQERGVAGYEVLRNRREAMKDEHPGFSQIGVSVAELFGMVTASNLMEGREEHLYPRYPRTVILGPAAYVDESSALQIKRDDAMFWELTLEEGEGWTFPQLEALNQARERLEAALIRRGVSSVISPLA